MRARIARWLIRLAKRLSPSPLHPRTVTVQLGVDSTKFNATIHNLARDLDRMSKGQQPMPKENRYPFVPRSPGERWEDLLMPSHAPIVDEALWDAASMGIDGWTLAAAIRATWRSE